MERHEIRVKQTDERERYLGAMDQGHAGQLLDLKTLVASVVSLRAGGRLHLEYHATSNARDMGRRVSWTWQQGDF